ncbi:MAG: tetratricopeptide repeat protein [Marinilabiliales bacterium]
MKNDWNFFQKPDLENELIQRYKKMLHENSNYYFDVFEFEDIIDYYLSKNELKKAGQAVDIALNQHPNSTAIIYKKANVLYESKKYNKALEILKYAQKISPDDYDIMILLGNIYLKKKNLKLAIDTYNTAIEMVHDLEDKLEVLNEIGLFLEINNQPVEAIKFYKRILQQKDTGYHSHTIIVISNCFEVAKKYVDGIRFFKKYLDDNPFSEDAWLQLGIMYSNNNQYEKAIESFDFGMAINPKNHAHYLNKAKSLIELNRKDEAVECLLEVTTLGEEYSELYAYIAEYFYFLDRFDLAKEYYQKTIDLDPDYEDAWYGLASINYLEKNYEESLKYIIRALDIEPDAYDFFLLKAKIHLKMHNYKEAITACRKAIKEWKNDSELWLVYGDIFYNQGKIEDAIKIVNTGLKHNKEAADLMFRLSAFYLLNNQKSLAIQQYKQALLIDSEMVMYFDDFADTHDDFYLFVNMLNDYLYEKDDELQS